MRALEHVLLETRSPVVYLNISRLTDYRKDGHPSIHRMEYKSEEERMAAERSQDCSHWCLPGVPDTWNELLYASLLKAGKGSWKNWIDILHSNLLFFIYIPSFTSFKHQMYHIPQLIYAARFELGWNEHQPRWQNMSILHFNVSEMHWIFSSICTLDFRDEVHIEVKHASWKWYIHVHAHMYMSVEVFQTSLTEWIHIKPYH